jgi:hypothetical protein
MLIKSIKKLIKKMFFKHATTSFAIGDTLIL